MPPGTGRGDGDRGSHVNVHIGFLERKYNPPKDPVQDRDLYHPYLRTGRLGKRVKSTGKIEYRLERYYLVKVPPEKDWELQQIEKQCNKGNYRNVKHTKPYIKIAIIEKEVNPGDTAGNTDPDGKPDLDPHS